MKTKQIKFRYNIYSFFYNVLEWPIEIILFRKWRNNLISPLKGKILEIGVGTGKNLPYYTNDAQVTGIDLSLGMLSHALKVANNLQHDFTLIPMDAEDLDFKDKTFDVVLCTFVLCSVPDPVKVLKEMQRVCKSDGKILMIEHVRSKNWFILLWQKLHNPFTRFFFGFNVTRDTVGNVRKAGLKLVSEEDLAVKDMFKRLICRPSFIQK